MIEFRELGLFFNGKEVTLYGSMFLGDDESVGQEIVIEGCPHPGIKTDKGIICSGNDHKKFLITFVKVGSKTIPAQEFQ